jgi:hypothetical protein
MRLAEIVRTGWLVGAAAGAFAGVVALRAPTVATSAPAVDVNERDQLSVHVRDDIGDSCASDVRTEGTRVYVHLREDPNTCSGVVRVYRIEGDHLIFEQELIDI